MSGYSLPLQAYWLFTYNPCTLSLSNKVKSERGRRRDSNLKCKRLGFKSGKTPPLSDEIHISSHQAARLIGATRVQDL